MSVGGSTAASTERPLALRGRADLVVVELQFAAARYWGVKDPVSLRYFQLRDEEYYILQQLDGRTSLAEIVERFEDRFTPRRLNVHQLHNFLGMLHRNGLVVSDAPEQAEPLLARRARQRRQEWGQALSNVLAIRIKGVDPERFLNWLYPKCGWMLSRASVAAVLALAVAALTLVIVQHEQLRARLPEFHAFFAATNLLGIALTLAGVKILHELGHALSCKRFGGECHELGIMFLVFTPCLYCNVTDSWLLKNKWHRAAIGAAGIYVELFLASVCTFLWWFSEPGILNATCLNIMFICSVTTLMFNGNPLLRYDGYYILSDVAEVPNLAQQSDAILRHGLAKWFLDVELVNERMLPERRKAFLVVYGVASRIYRIFIVLAILWFVHQFFKPYGLQVVAQLIAATVVIGMFVVPAVKAVRFLADPLRSRDVKWPRLIVSAAAVAALLAGVLLVPLPYRVAAPALIQPQNAHRIYVSAPGRIVDALEPGTPVAAGDVLARLDNPQLAREVAQLTAKRDEQQLHVENLVKLRNDDPTAADQIPAAEEALADVQQRLQKRLSDWQQLQLRAPVAGTVLPPPKKPKMPTEGELETWSGTPLDHQNRGSLLETGTLLCQVGSPNRLEALLVVDQADVEMVRLGQRVRLRFYSLPGEVFVGCIEEIAQSDLESVPPELIAGNQLPAVQDKGGAARPASTTYQVRVSLELDERPLLLSATGRAKIQAAPRSLLWRLWQYLTKTFRFEL